MLVQIGRGGSFQQIVKVWTELERAFPTIVCPLDISIEPAEGYLSFSVATNTITANE
jgi:hypothetical protein